ncbi:GNAT family N-acetyltransferase [Streptomyces calidiresistens]|uniref:GNAT family N-acetyltransferase n=1 Tax=Streptomyces calidiresistens TaxID=1485586 RepID=A0A7W3T126_9ACTN|nr:GNAT family N-acetyltransferase [Streptomyces calidiresistens]MBB0229019.1 GNAT family N-acetyltransferase [Streptomyces calidiresistens]
MRRFRAAGRLPGVRDGYEISTESARLDTDRIHRWLSRDAYWALGRSREKQEAAIAGSLNFGLYRTTSGEQVGYARVVTDRTTFAWLCDVYLDPVERGCGVGTEFIGAVRDHLDGWGLKRIMLATHDAHGLYARLGFRPLDRPDRWMIFESG